MLPALLRLHVGTAEFVLTSYSTFMTLALVAIVGLGTLIAARRGLPARRVAVVLAASGAAALVGGRLLDLFVAGGTYARDPAAAVSLSFQGFSLYGALLMGAGTAVGMAALLRVPVWRFADSVAPALGVGIALMRVGCFLKGCCFGVPTTLPWGVMFPTGSPAWEQQMLGGATGILGGLAGRVLPVHPTQIYELLAALALAGLAAWLLRRRVVDGAAFLVFAIGLTAFRFADYFLRARTAAITAPAWFYPIFYAGLICVLAALMAWRVAFARERARTRTMTRAQARTSPAARG